MIPLLIEMLNNINGTVSSITNHQYSATLYSI